MRDRIQSTASVDLSAPGSGDVFPFWGGRAGLLRFANLFAEGFLLVGLQGERVHRNNGHTAPASSRFGLSRRERCSLLGGSARGEGPLTLPIVPTGWGVDCRPARGASPPTFQVIGSLVYAPVSQGSKSSEQVTGLSPSAGPSRSADLPIGIAGRPWTEQDSSGARV
jgi:hypothetical protein